MKTESKRERKNTFFHTAGYILTWLSSPRVNSMKKKRKDQKGERGSIVMAWGYTTNAKPGPERQAKCKTY